MRRGLRAVAALTAVGGSVAAYGLLSGSDDPVGIPVTEDRLTTEVFGDREQARCVMQGLQDADVSPHVLDHLLNDSELATPEAVGGSVMEKIDTVVRECGDEVRARSAVAAVTADVGVPGDASDPSTQGRMIAIDPELPERASNR
jgi:hypothetical protein